MLNSYDLYLLLARAYAKNQQLADAYQARAKAYVLDDERLPAIALLQQALKLPKLSTTDLAIINAKISQLQADEKNL